MSPSSQTSTRIGGGMDPSRATWQRLNEELREAMREWIDATQTDLRGVEGGES